MCDAYRVDVTADLFGTCVCGQPKEIHQIAALEQRRTGRGVSALSSQLGARFNPAMLQPRRNGMNPHSPNSVPIPAPADCSHVPWSPLRCHDARSDSRRRRWVDGQHRRHASTWSKAAIYDATQRRSSCSSTAACYRGRTAIRRRTDIRCAGPHSAQAVQRSTYTSTRQGSHHA